jgi:ABC-type polysaccharide/polyol phosphate transport system ATPase subunit
MSTAIELHGVGKRYRKLEQEAMLMRSVLPFARPAKRELWALRDLDLTVEPGEIVGVLGHNGAGKTTLLRLLAGVTSPTEGRVRVTGRIAPLISLGVGFHGEMSGRENVLVNGMLLGLSAEQVAERFDQIVEFAELWEFIDTPVKFYSTGMSMRLGFAVIIHIDPTILLVDEILAVGDASFQLKCFDRLRDFQQQGAAILMVSHQLHQVRQLCQRAVLIRHGRLQYDGDTEEAIALHEALADDDDETAAATAGAVEIVETRLVGRGEADQLVQYDEPVELEAGLRFHRTVEDPVIVVSVRTSRHQLAGFNVTQPGQPWRTFKAGDEPRVRVAFKARLGGGCYEVTIAVRARDGGRVLARAAGPRITVGARDGVTGMADVDARLAVERL